MPVKKKKESKIQPKSKAGKVRAKKTVKTALKKGAKTRNSTSRRKKSVDSLKMKKKVTRNKKQETNKSKNPKVQKFKKVKTTAKKYIRAKSEADARIKFEKDQQIEAQEMLQETFNVDQLLIDEQVDYSEELKTETAVLEKKAESDVVALKELDKMIEADDFSPKTRQQNGINISLSKSYGQAHFSPSAKALNLRQTLTEEQETIKVSAPTDLNSNLIKKDKSLSQAYKFSIPKPTLIKKDLLKDVLTFFKNFKPKSKVKTRRSHIQAVGENLWLERLRVALNFALVTMLIILPIKGVYVYDQVAKTKGQVLGASQTALAEFGNALSAAETADWQKATVNFSQAQSYFKEASLVLSGYDNSLAELVGQLPVLGKKYSDGHNLLLAGEKLANAATNLSVAMNTFSQVENLESTVGSHFPDIKDSLNLALDDLAQALIILEKVNEKSLPDQYQTVFRQIKNNIPVIESGLSQVQTLFNAAYEMLGYDGARRYLFLFQNNNELRATGGFLGSFALVDLKNGQIVNLEVPGGGLYDLTAGYLEKTISPAPMHLLGTPWMPWDQNWWPDFPTSANKLMQTFEKAGWPSFDGVIAINATMLPRILEVVGEVVMPEYDQILTPDNVILALQHEAEFEYNKTENQPKKIIGDLMQVVIERLLKVSNDQIVPLILTFEKSFKEKEIQMHFTDQELSRTANLSGWDGSLAEYSKDYLMVVRTNIAGGKTDLVIDQKIRHYAYLQTDGSIINTVAITLTHTGDSEDVFERAGNNSYVRVYVPEQSELLEVSGYDIIEPSKFKEVYEGFSQDPDLMQISGQIITDLKNNTDINNEFGRTVFGNWIQVEPGESQTLSFSYKLPFELSFESAEDNFFKNILKSAGFLDQNHTAGYGLTIQKQSGVKSEIESRFYYPDDTEVLWQASAENDLIEVNDDYLVLESLLNKDNSYAVLLQKN